MDAFIVFCLAFQVTEAFNKLQVFREASFDYWTLVCTAEDNGDAFVWNSDMNRNWRSSMAFKSTYTGKSDTDCTEPYNRCTWHRFQWTETNWKENPTGPVLDSRWEDFREYKNADTYERIDTLPKKGALAFSIRGLEEAHISFCRNKSHKYSSCYELTIKMEVPPSGKKQSNPSKPRSSEGNNCVYKDQLSPIEWRHYLLKWDSDNRNITLYNNETFLITCVQFEHWKNLKEVYLFHKISNLMHIRYHNYTYLYTKQNSYILDSPWLQLKNNNICFRLSIALCAKCSVSISLYTQGGYHYKETLVIVHGIMTAYGLPAWQHVKLNMTVLNSSIGDTVLIRIIPAIKGKDQTKGFWAVRNIVKCPPPETMKISHMRYEINAEVDKKKNNMPNAACQRISYTRNEIVNANANTVALETDDYDCPNGSQCLLSCKSFYRTFNENCHNVAICNTKGCTCHTGLMGDNCTQICDNNKYGYMCNKTCGLCLKDQCNYKTGYCIDQMCDNKDAYHLPPFCDIEIKPPPAPTILFVNETNVQAEIIAKDEYKKTTVEYNFIVKNGNTTFEHGHPHRTIFPNTTTLEITISKLKPGTHYQIFCSLVIKEENFVMNGPSTSFRTPCAFRIDLKIATDVETLTATANIPKKVSYPCPFDSYNVKVIEFETQNITCEKRWIEMPLIFKGLEPATTYEVIVSDEENSKNISRVARTKDVSSPVESIHYNISSDSNVYLNWKKPKKPNGLIKEYEVILNITRYYGCFDLKRETKPREFIRTRTKMTNITFRDLQPYTMYTAIIYAWNSNRGKVAFVNFSTGSTKIPRSSYSNLRQQGNNLVWDPPKDCSTISGPINATKLNFIGLSEVVKNYTYEKIVHGNSFDITGTEFYGKETYKVFVYPIRDIHGIHNSSTYKDLIFHTPAKAPSAVKNLEIVEIDTRINSILLRWQEPFPPNGKIAYYRVADCLRKPCKLYVKNVTNDQYCPLWDNYICVTIDQNLKKFFKIAVYAVNENVDEDGEYAYASYNSLELVSDRPENVSAMVYPKKKIVTLSWSHPWRTRLALKSFLIRMDINNSKLIQTIPEEELHMNYTYIVTKYERTYNINLSLLPSTSYKFSVYPITINGKNGKGNNGSFETPALLAFEGKMSYRFESETIICLQIPKVTYNTKNSKIYVVVKGNNPCKGYVKLNQFLRRHVNVESSKEIAWLAASTSANLYIDNEFCVGDNATHSANCPLKYKAFYTVIVIVQPDAKSTNDEVIVTSIQFGDVSRRHDEVWVVPIVIILIIIVVIFFLYRRSIRKMPRKNLSVLYDAKKIIPMSPDLSEANRSLCNSVTDISSQSIEANSDDKDLPMPIKVKDFEDYVKNAIKSGLLEKQYGMFPRGSTKPCDYGKLPENTSKNRYKNLVAYDETRVVLKKLQDDPFSDYINANYIKGYKMEKRYIATQGPKANTVVDFWRMVWQENVLVICMLANVFEHGKTKCEQYWPEVGKKKQYGDVKVVNVKHDVFADYTFRMLHVTYDGETRQVKHLHYTTWPDHGIPMYTHSVAAYLKKLLATQIGTGPVVVHCSAGVGRTGTIILGDICLRRAAAEGVVDVFSETRSIRSQRINMVDNKQQYMFAHLMIMECLLAPQTSLPCDQNLSARIKEMKELVNKQFQRLEDTTWQDEALRDTIDLSCVSERNLAKHRYPELVSKKVSRIYLKKYPPDIEDSDYIAAVYVDGLKKQNQYLASQLPLPSTFSDFWRMIAEFKVELIVVLQPPDLDDPTCCPIVPTDDEFQPTPYINVTTKQIVNDEYYVSHKLKLVDKSKKSESEQSITILSSTKYEAGQNKDPPSVDALVKLWQATGRIARDDNNPTVILCHDGVTACGLYLALSFLLERMAIERECDVCFAIRTVKRSIPNFLRSTEQMEYLYDAALTYAEYFKTYANFS